MTSIPSRPQRVAELPATVQPSEDMPRSRADQSLVMVLGIGAVLILLTLMGVRFFSDERSSGSSEEPSGAPAALTEEATATPTVPPTMTIPATSTLIPTLAPTATPACRVAADWLDQISFAERRGDWKTAAETAELALTDRLCTLEDRRLLEEKAVNDGLRAIYNEPFLPEDVLGQEARVVRYEALRERARQTGIPFPSDAQIALEARARGQFLLAKAAFEAAFSSGELTTTDRDQLRAYVSTLHDLAVWRIEKATGEAREEGYRLLVSCHLLDVQERLGSGACIGRLQQELGSDATAYPPAAPSPLLALDKEGT